MVIKKPYYFDEGTKTGEGVLVSENDSKVNITTSYQNIKMNKPSPYDVFSIEFTITREGGNIAIGVGDIANATSRLYFTGYYASGVSINYSDGSLYRSNNRVTTISNFKSEINDVLAIKVDKINKNVYFYKNGVDMGYVYNIPFSFTDLIVELGTGAQTNGELVINFKQKYNYGAPPYKNYTNKTLILSQNEYKKWNEEIPEQEEIWSTTKENAIPLLTSNTSNGLAFSQTAYSTSLAWRAFDENTSTYYSTNTNSPNGYIGYVSSEEMEINSYSIESYNSNCMKSWKLSISNDTTNGADGTWEIVEARGDFTWTNREVKSFELSQPVKAKAIRFDFIGISNNSCSISSIYMYKPLQLIQEAVPYVAGYWSDIEMDSLEAHQFLSDGMDSLSPLLDRKVTTLEPLPMSDKSGNLPVGEEGKVFSKAVDLKKYMDIRSIRVGVE